MRTSALIVMLFLACVCVGCDKPSPSPANTYMVVDVYRIADYKSYDPYRTVLQNQRTGHRFITTGSWGKPGEVFAHFDWFPSAE